MILLHGNYNYCLRRNKMGAKRFILNETSYHGTRLLIYNLKKRTFLTRFLKRLTGVLKRLTL